jgi:hypothetical protein
MRGSDAIAMLLDRRFAQTAIERRLAAGKTIAVVLFGIQQDDVRHASAPRFDASHCLL